MKQEMTCIDIASIIIELSENQNSIIGAKVLKIYSLDFNTIRIHLYLQSKRKENLIIEPGRRFHFSQIFNEAPKTPTSFSMLLRKHIMGGRIETIEQQDFDRIIKLKIKRGLDTIYLVIELFSKGNIILLDKNNKIIFSFKSIGWEQLHCGDTYTYKSNKKNPLTIQQEDFINYVKEYQSCISSINNDISFLLSDIFSLGKLYTEEILTNLKFKKKEIFSTIDLKNIYLSIKELLHPIIVRKLTPQIIYDTNQNCLNERTDIKSANFENTNENKIIDVIPFNLNLYSKKNK